MPSYDYTELLTTAQTAGTNLNTFTTAASAIPSQAVHTLAPDDWSLGKSLLIKAAGRVSNVVTTQPTFTFQVMFGATIAFTTGAILTSTTVHTTVPWTLEVQLTCRSLGSGTSATLMGQGTTTSRAWIDAGATADITTLGHTTLLVPETTPAVGTGWSSNASQAVDFFIACSASAAGNAIQVEQYWLMQMN